MFVKPPHTHIHGMDRMLPKLNSFIPTMITLSILKKKMEFYVCIETGQSHFLKREP